MLESSSTTATIFCRLGMGMSLGLIVANLSIRSDPTIMTESKPQETCT